MEAREPLKLLIGGAGSGKTAAALAEYRQTLRNSKASGGMALAVRRHGHVGDEEPCPRGRGHATPEAGAPYTRLLWLAPTFGAAADVRDALVEGPQDAFLDPGVTTFADLAEALIRDSGRRVRLISALQRRRLLARVVDDALAQQALEYFAPVAQSPGFLALAGDWIANRKRRNAPHGKSPRPTAGPDPRTRDLVELYGRYEAQLAAAGLGDLEGALWLAVDALETNPELAGNLELVVADGFSDFTAAEHALLRLLRRQARRTWVTLVGEAGGVQGASGREELWAKSAATIERFEQDGAVQIFSMDGSSAPRGRVSPRREVESRRDSSTWPALVHLERNLFRSFHEIEPVPPAAAATADRIHILAASGVQAEIDEIARRVKRLLVSGAAPGDVTVAFRSTRDVADRVRQAFGDFGIPFSLDSPRRLATAPLVRSLANVLRLAAEDWPYRRVLDVAGDRLVGAMGDDAVRTAVERCVRQAQLPSGRAALVSQVAAWADSDDAEVTPESAPAVIAAPVLARLSEALDALPKRARVAAWTAAVEQLAVELEMLAAAADADAWSALVRGLLAVEQIDHWTGASADAVDAAGFLEIMLATAAYLPAPEPYDPAGRVAVLSAEAARFARPRHLFLGGLGEQSFAAGRRTELDEDADEPSRARQRESAADEMLLFYQVATRAGETLTLSYPALDDKAQALVPSPLVAELERALAGAPIGRTVQSLGEEPREAGPIASRRDLRRAAVEQAQERRRDLLAALASATPGWHALRSAEGRGDSKPDATTPFADSERATQRGEVGRSILDGIEAVASRGRRDGFGGFEGLVVSEAIAAELARNYGPEHLWSPSQLETYAECPFRFYGEQVLRLEPAPEMALASDMQRRGSLLHETLARLYAELAASAPAPTDDPTEAARTLVEQFHARLGEVAGARPGRGLGAALREIERRQVAAWAERLAQQHADYHERWQHLDEPMRPAYFEASFGPRRRRSESPSDASLSTAKEFELAVPVGGAQERVRFGGQIDRIDVGRVGGRLVFNVIDYKSGATSLDAAKIDAGKQLQLPLYTMAVEQLLLAEQQASPLAASYWSVGGRGQGGFARGGRGPKPLEINTVEAGRLQPAPGWGDRQPAIVKRIGELIAGIRRGAFPVFNDDEKCTQFCVLRTACRIAQVRSLDKHWPAPEAKP